MRPAIATIAPFHTLLIICLSVLPGWVTAQDYSRTKVTFRSGNHTLHGELLRPVGVHTAPAVVFLPGPGESSYRTNYKDFAEENMEHLLAGLGIAVFYFDKRGIGSSSGNWKRTGFEAQATDAIAAVRYLKGMEGIDSARIGVVGHGHGGYVAMLCAGRYSEVAFAASLAGPTVPLRQQLAMEHATPFRCDGTEYTRAMEQGAQAADKAISRSRLLPCGERRYLKEISHFDPAESIAAINIPFLLLFATNDGHVYPTPCLTRLKAIFDGQIPGHITARTIPKSDHFFHIGPMCPGDDEALAKPSRSYDFKDVLRIWLMVQTMG